MTEPDPDHFEMRRLESLSNTIFGVAMTLLAYDLLKASQFQSAPDWSELYRLYGTRLTGLVLSFVIAGTFWFSHQRRLARQPYASRNVLFLNLLFLLSIILLPVSDGLYGSYGLSSTVAGLYGLHLTVIATRRNMHDFSGFSPLAVCSSAAVSNVTRRIPTAAPDAAVG